MSAGRSHWPTESPESLRFLLFLSESFRLRSLVISTGYKLVQLANGARGIQSLAYGETMHSAIGPTAEAEALYVKQLRLVERIREHAGEFVIWDVGLGAAANA